MCSFGWMYTVPEQIAIWLHASKWRLIWCNASVCYVQITIASRYNFLEDLEKVKFDNCAAINCRLKIRLYKPIEVICKVRSCCNNQSCRKPVCLQLSI